MMGSVSKPAGEDILTDRIPTALVLGSGLGAMLMCAELAALRFSVRMMELPDPMAGDLYCSVPEVDVQRLRGSLMSAMEGIEVFRLKDWPKIGRDQAGFHVDVDHFRSHRFDTLFFAGGPGTKRPALLRPDLFEPYKPESFSVDQPENLVFLMDYPEPTDPAAGMSAIASALSNAKIGGRSSVVLKNAPVRHLHGETLYDSAKTSGVIFYRFVDGSIELARKKCSETGVTQVCVSFQDCIEMGADHEITCDRLLLVTGPDNEGIPSVAGYIPGMDIDRNGFMISDSAHCKTFKSFNRGIYCIGGFSGTTDLLNVISQAKAAAAHARSFALACHSENRQSVLSISDQCIRCLTCHRICPHSAIWVSAASSRSQMKSIGAACVECGICVSECPRIALDLRGFPETAFSGFIEDIGRENDKIVVYGCSRSAARAISSLSLPPDVVFFSTPCAGSISEKVILETINAGARGVLIVGCHHGNCASRNGTDWACDRVRSVVDNFVAPLEIKAPLEYRTVAPNEATKLERTIRRFVEKVHSKPDCL